VNARALPTNPSMTSSHTIPFVRSATASSSPAPESAPVLGSGQTSSPGYQWDSSAFPRQLGVIVCAERGGTHLEIVESALETAGLEVCERVGAVLRLLRSGVAGGCWSSAGSWIRQLNLEGGRSAERGLTVLTIGWWHDE